MSTAVEVNELEEILNRVRRWPDTLRIRLAREVLETMELEQPPPVPRGRPVSELIGLGAGTGPPPDDEEVKRWIDEHRMEKYG